MSKIIYAIYVNTGIVGRCLDAIRLLASPSAKRFSHLTVRGPYDLPLDEKELLKLNSKLEPNDIYVYDVGNFFESDLNQNTVYFTCKGKSIKNVWDKRSYGRLYNPHVTVYDGLDRDFAKSVFNVIKKYKYNVRCGDDKLVPFEIGNGKNGNLLSQFSVDDLPEELGLKKSFLIDVIDMPTRQRLEQIDKISKFLSSCGNLL